MSKGTRARSLFPPTYSYSKYIYMTDYIHTYTFVSYMDAMCVTGKSMQYIIL